MENKPDAILEESATAALDLTKLQHAIRDGIMWVKKGEFFSLLTGMSKKGLELIIQDHRLASNFKQTQKNICTKCNQVKLTRQQIANMTGLRVETVIRTIRNLQSKGQLHITKGKVYC